MRQGMPGGGKMGVWVEHHVHLSIPDFIITRSVHLDKPKLCVRSSLSNPEMLYALCWLLLNAAQCQSCSVEWPDSCLISQCRLALIQLLTKAMT